METKALRKQLGAAIAMVIVAAIALGAATFAWFVNNTKVTADGATVSATTANTLLIKNESGEWGTTNTFADSNVNFKPVSTIGANSNDSFNFFAQNNWAKDASGNITVNKVSSADGSEYWTKDFEIKASQACKLYLDEDTKFVMGGDNNTTDKVMRLALVVTNENGDWKATKFYQINPNENGTGHYNTTLESLKADGIKTAIASSNEGTPVAGNIVSAASKALTGDNKALATADPDNGLNATVGTADELYDFTQNNEVCKIKAYIWMEGCDYDCNNDTVNEITGAANTFKATLGFCAGKSA